ncbi:CBS domain-containing protein [Calidifontibacillus oryziterrae]|uniref:CBS domain-containing protein n=1 Tax=Calidifontibacillus oryziterrae TaxID=1191699 RepID=UPI0002EFF1FF|nr:CBS domain-containing protein [Calidifontibacillus oryziterrae]
MGDASKDQYKNSERFISAFNTITKELEKMVDVGGHIPFYRLVDMSKKKNGTVMTYKDDLKELSHLRNAIVHDKAYPEYAIAEPHISIVELIEKIAAELSTPKTIIPFFERKVKTFQKNDNLKAVLLSIKKHGYSQFPIYDHEKFVGLITDRGITRWMAQHVDNISIESILDTRLDDVLSFEKNKRNYVFMNKDQNIYDVREKFLHHSDLYSTRLEAILITETGRSDEKLLGIATPYDMVRIPFRDDI